jgi:hypothetical protein
MNDLHVLADCAELEQKRQQDDESTETDDEQTVLKKRSRSPSASADIVIPPLKKPRPRGRPRGSTKINIQAQKEKKVQEEKSEVFRKQRLYPEQLLSKQSVPLLTCSDKSQIAAAEEKLQQVLKGEIPFGRNIFLPTFEPKLPAYEIHATLPNLFFLNVLFSNQVIETSKGKVSVFPVTIFNNQQNFQTRKNGFPCLMFHTGHMKTLMWRIYSVCRQLFKNGTFEEHLEQVVCSFSPRYNPVLNAITGFEPYDRLTDSYIFIPAHWLDAMKSLFIDPQTFKAVDIGELLRSTYKDMSHKFSEDFRCLWLGEERNSNVSAMLGDPTAKHVFSMTRCRAVNNQVCIDGNPLFRWKLADCGRSSQPYDEFSFAYGVQCWKEQLQFLNTTVCFFNEQAQPKETYQEAHQVSLFHYDTNTPIKTRQQSLSAGILDDSTENVLLSKDTRRQRHAIKTQYGIDFMTNYLGNFSVYMKQK